MRRSGQNEEARSWWHVRRESDTRVHGFQKLRVGESTALCTHWGRKLQHVVRAVMRGEMGITQSVSFLASVCILVASCDERLWLTSSKAHLIGAMSFLMEHHLFVLHLDFETDECTEYPSLRVIPVAYQVSSTFITKPHQPECTSHISLPPRRRLLTA